MLAARAFCVMCVSKWMSAYVSVCGFETPGKTYSHSHFKCTQSVCVCKTLLSSHHENSQQCVRLRLRINRCVYTKWHFSLSVAALATRTHKLQRESERVRNICKRWKEDENTRMFCTTEMAYCVRMPVWRALYDWLFIVHNQTESTRERIDAQKRQLRHTAQSVHIDFPLFRFHLCRRTTAKFALREKNIIKYVCRPKREERNIRKNDNNDDEDDDNESTISWCGFVLFWFCCMWDCFDAFFSRSLWLRLNCVFARCCFSIQYTTFVSTNIHTTRKEHFYKWNFTYEILHPILLN